jgi:hypothetical protein
MHVCSSFPTLDAASRSDGFPFFYNVTKVAVGTKMLIRINRIHQRILDYASGSLVHVRSCCDILY